ncbi:MAG TPA: signal peptidase I [Clostridiaceae bacterium]|nr:signal peptidase I [Clostridiaceae bacterium]
MIKKIVKWGGNVILILIVIAAFVSIYFMIQSKRNPDKIPSVAGFSVMTVLSGSMSPYLEAGDMIVIKETDPLLLKEGDVITYRQSSGLIVTHRVIELSNGENGLMFRTKGDANNVEDAGFVSENQLIGKVAFKIPYGGHVARFVRTPFGFVIFILIPVIILILGEARKINQIMVKEKREDMKRRVIGK